MAEDTINAEQQEITDNFQRAVNAKDLVKMQSLLDQGANINVENVRGVTPLYAAILAKNEAMTDWLLERGASPNIRNSAGDNPMVDAARMDDSTLLKKLIRYNGDVNLTTTLGNTPLMEACINRRLSNVRLLLDAGADPSIKTIQGTSAILNAARAHEYEIVEVLLKAGASANDRDKTYGITPLIAACGVLPGYDPADSNAKSLKTVKVLLQAGAQPNEKANSGNTPMAEAAKTDNRSVLLELLHAGADPNVKTAGALGEISPLMVACAKHDLELVKALLASKADPMFTNAKGENAVYMTMAGRIQDEKEKKVVIEILDLLYAQGAKADFTKKDTGMAHFGLFINEPGLIDKAAALGGLNQQDKEGHTALHLAIHMNNNKAVKQIIDLGIDVTLADNRGVTALQMAASGNGSPKVRAVIQQLMMNPDPEKQEKGKKLAEELKELLYTVTDQLVAAGADINAEDKEKRSILMTAVYAFASGAVERKYIDKLVGMGANILQENDNGDTPFIVAIKMGNEDLVTTWAQKLIDEGQQDVITNAIMNVSWSAPEHPTAVENMRKVFQRLIEMGANINAQDEDGQGPVLIASATNQEDLLNLLLDLGSDPNLKNHEGEVPLVHAIANNNPNISKVLFERGAVDNVLTNDGEDLMSIAYRYQVSTIVNQISEAKSARIKKEEEAEDLAEAERLRSIPKRGM